jgi:DHA2 family multidrug resistance protein
MTVGTLFMSTLTSQSSGDDMAFGLYFRTLALGFLYVPLTMGSLSDLADEDVGAGSGIINLSRQFGGSIGIAMISTFLDRRTSMHYGRLVDHVTATNRVFQDTIQQYQGYLYHNGLSMIEAHGTALKVVALKMQLQATVLAYDDIFWGIAIVFAAATPLALIATRRTASQRNIAVH